MLCTWVSFTVPQRAPRACQEKIVSTKPSVSLEHRWVWPQNQKNKYESQSSGIAGRVFALHLAHPGSISGAHSITETPLSNARCGPKGVWKVTWRIPIVHDSPLIWVLTCNLSPQKLKVVKLQEAGSSQHRPRSLSDLSPAVAGGNWGQSHGPYSEGASQEP